MEILAFESINWIRMGRSCCKFVKLHDQSLISRSRSKVSREIYETWKLSISYDTYTVYGI